MYDRPMTDDSCDLLCLDIPLAEAIRGALPDAATLDQAAAQFKALGDPTRLAIALALAEGGRACVCDLGWVVGRPERLVSHHVRALKAAGLARSSREGRMVIYELTPAGRVLLDAAPTAARVASSAPVRTGGGHA
jgi:DNA-binding transcriptional ArsR family regulator